MVCARSEEHAAAGAPGREAYALVLARAVGPLATVVELAAPLLAPGAACWYRTTGRRAEAEWAAGEAAGTALRPRPRRGQPLARSPLAHSVCVVARKVGPTPEWLPRRAGPAHARTAVSGR